MIYFALSKNQAHNICIVYIDLHDKQADNKTFMKLIWMVYSPLLYSKLTIVNMWKRGESYNDYNQIRPFCIFNENWLLESDS